MSQSGSKLPGNELQENLIESWIGMTSLFKNSRITKQLTYNESSLLFCIRRLQEDEFSSVPVKQLLKVTKMKKSLLNRTIDSLVNLGFLEKQKDTKDARNLLVRIRPEKLPEYLELHEESLDLISQIISVIGTEDAEAFVRIYQKLKSFDTCLF